MDLRDPAEERTRSAPAGVGGCNERYGTSRQLKCNLLAFGGRTSVVSMAGGQAWTDSRRRRRRVHFSFNHSHPAIDLHTQNIRTHQEWPLHLNSNKRRSATAFSRLVGVCAKISGGCISERRRGGRFLLSDSVGLRRAHRAQLEEVRARYYFWSAHRTTRRLGSPKEKSERLASSAPVHSRSSIRSPFERLPWRGRVNYYKSPGIETFTFSGRRRI